ncbi:hypothetical protein VTO73DRAFT_10006 [Trametes versicolor]
MLQSSPPNRLDLYNPWPSQRDVSDNIDESDGSTLALNFTDVIQMLDDDAIRVSRSGPSWRTIFRHVPEVALAYALHVGVRGVRPRRLPAFTSMKLREIYTGLGLASIAEAAATDYMSQVASDDELSACDVAAYAWTSRKVNMAVGGISDENISWLRAWRLGNYDNRDLLGKLAWWHNHIWSDETTWVWAAALWFTYFYDEENPEIRSDHNIYITHLANVRGAHLSRTLSPGSMASLLGFRCKPPCSNTCTFLF